MSKKNRNQNFVTSNDNQQNRLTVNVYRWKQRKKFTVLEDFTIKILEKESLSDEKIAKIFCLEAEDMADIVKDINKEYKGTIQGDHTQRSLCEGFSRHLPDKIAIEKEKLPNSSANVKFLEKIKHGQKSDKSTNNLRNEHGAEVFSLEITFNPNDENTVFRCNGVDVPESFYDILKEKSLLKKNKKQ